MPSATKRRSRRRAVLGTGRLLLAAALLTGLTGLVPSVAPAEAQALAPARPLLLIGGTLAPYDHQFYDRDGDGVYDHDGDGVFDGNDEVPSWPHVKSWLTSQGGYTDEVNLYVRELARQDVEPPNWGEGPLAQFGMEWDGPPGGEDEFVTLLERYSGSTAGLAPMQTSVDHVKLYITLISGAHGGSQIDIVAHSQAGPVARAAIRQLQEDGDTSNDDKVHTLVSLGSADYGISEDAPEFRTGSWLGDRLSEGLLEDCRDDGWLPLCPDFVRLHSDWPLDWIPPDPAQPAGNPGLYRPGYGFFPALNDHANQGPTPGTTRYFHISSTIFEPGGGTEALASEILPLYVDGPGVQNWTAQSFCQNASPAVPSYDVHHIEEWVNPVMRKMIGWALGFDTVDPGDYAACHLPH